MLSLYTFGLVKQKQNTNTEQCERDAKNGAYASNSENEKKTPKIRKFL